MGDGVGGRARKAVATPSSISFADLPHSHAHIHTLTYPIHPPRYGPDTNFWLKFRPTLACHHIPRLGPELGGAKAWCNPHAWPPHPDTQEGGGPKHVLSMGSGDDFMYEHFVAEQWPGVKIVTTDCFQFSQSVSHNFSDNKGQLLILPVCLTGEEGKDGSPSPYTQFIHPQIRDRFVSYPSMMEMLREDHGIDQFDLIKCNIEASEYVGERWERDGRGRERESMDGTEIKRRNPLCLVVLLAYQ